MLSTEFCYIIIMAYAKREQTKKMDDKNDGKIPVIYHQLELLYEVYKTLTMRNRSILPWHFQVYIRLRDIIPRI